MFLGINLPWKKLPSGDVQFGGAVIAANQTSYALRKTGGPVEEPSGRFCFSNFSDPVANYTYQYGGASDYISETNYVRYGSASIRTTVPASGSRAFSKELGYTVDWTRFKNFRISCYIQGVVNASNVRLLIYGGTNYAEITLRNLVEGWNNFTVNREGVYDGPGMDWATFTKVRFNATAGAGGEFSITWDVFNMFPGPAKSYAAFTFDDGFSSVANLLVPLFAKYGAVATSFVPGQFIGTAGKMTAAQIRSVRDYGWDIGAHGNTHAAAYDTLTPAQIQADIDGCDAAFVAAGLDLPTLGAYPITYTASDIDRERVIYSRYRAMRAGGGTANRTNSGQTSYPMRSAAVMPGYSLTVGAAQAVAVLGTAKANNAPIIFYCHDVANVAPAQGMSTADLTTVLDYCVANSIEIVSMSQLLDQCPGVCGGLW